LAKILSIGALGGISCGKTGVREEARAWDLEWWEVGAFVCISIYVEV